jgi:hypothetical protein
MSLAQGQIYKGTTGSYSAISSPFKYIPFGDSLKVGIDQIPINTNVPEADSTWWPGPIVADNGVFINSSEWLDNSTWSSDGYQDGGGSINYRQFAGPSKTQPYNGDGLFTRTTLGAVALQGQDDSNHWGQTFSQGLSAVQNGQFTFMVGSSRDAAPGYTINGLSNTLVTKRFKLVAGQTDMSASANVTLVAYDPALHPTDWDSQWVLSTDGNQLTYYAGANSSTNFEDLNSNINNVAPPSTKLEKGKIYQGDSSSYAPIDSPLEILARVGPGTNGTSDIFSMPQVDTQSWYTGEGSWQAGRYGNTNNSQFHDPFTAVTQGLMPQGPFGVIGNTDDVTGDPILTYYKDFFIARKTNDHWLVEYSISHKDFPTPTIGNGIIRLTFKLVSGQSVIDTSSWEEGQPTPILVDILPAAGNPSDWANNWVLSSDAQTLYYFTDDASGTTGLAPLSIDSFEFGDLSESATPPNNEPTNNDPVTITDGGSGYPSTGTNVAVENGSGKGMTVDYEATAGAVTEVTISDPGVDYEVGDQVQITGGSSPATITLNQASPDSDVGETINGRTIIARNEAGQFGTNSMMDSVVSIESENSVNVDPIVYQQKVNYVHEQMFSTSSYSFPCYDNISEYEVINLGSDALNYSDNTDSISLTGFYGS